MELIDFENEIDEVILQRGKAYYTNVKWIKQVGAGEWLAEVVGSESYQVVVKLEEERLIKETSCDCPYDWGNYCKHQVAVFYGLRAILCGEDMATKEPVNQVTRSDKQEIVNLLEQQSKAALVDLLANYAVADYQIKNDLQMKFLPRKAANNVIVNQAKRVLATILDRAEWGFFVDYEETEEVARDALEVLELCRQLPAEESLPKIDICLLVVEGLLVIMLNSDDSHGYINGVVGEGIELVQETLILGTEQSREQEKEIMLILESIEQKFYEDWQDYRLALLESCVLAAQNTIEQKAIEKMLSIIKKQLSTDSFYSVYVGQELEKMHYQLLLKFADSQIANAYLRQHLTNPEFRRIVINHEMTKEKFEQAVALCLQGEEVNQEHSELVIEWQEQRYQIYQLLGNSGEQIKLAEELLMKGVKSYYYQLKELYTVTEWPEKLMVILTTLEKSTEQQRLYRFIILKEKLKSRLLRYCEENLFEIANVYGELLPEYEGEALSLYADYIKAEAASATTRKQYQGLCRLLRNHKKYCGAAQTRTIVDELKSNYKRKPALLDELNRLVL